MGQGVGDPASSQPALGRDKEGDSGDTLSDTSPPTENEAHPVGQVDQMAWKEKERRASRGHKGRWSGRLRHRVPSRVCLALAEDN